MSNSEDRRLRLFTLFWRMKYFCACDATCVGGARLNEVAGNAAPVALRKREEDVRGREGVVSVGAEIDRVMGQKFCRLGQISTRVGRALIWHR